MISECEDQDFENEHQDVVNLNTNTEVRWYRTQTLMRSDLEYMHQDVVNWGLARD